MCGDRQEVALDVLGQMIPEGEVANVLVDRSRMVEKVGLQQRGELLRASEMQE